MIYIFMEGELFLMVLSLSTGSLKKAISGSGIAFSQAIFTFDRVLNADENTAMAKMTESVKAYAANLTTADNDVLVGDARPRKSLNS